MRLTSISPAAVAFALATVLLCGGNLVADPAKKPAVPPGRDPGGVAVATIGDGIDYTRTEIALRLARDGEGEIVGFDLTDKDRRPFSSAANLLGETILRESGPCRLAVFRAERGDLRQTAEAVAMVGKSPARIALVTTVTSEEPDWPFLKEASRRFPDILFVVPAGDAKRTLDASISLDNVIVVTEAAFARTPANQGPDAVDLALLPSATSAEDDGTRHQSARIAALAARIVAAEPDLKGAAIKERIVGLAKPFPAGSPKTTRFGWIEAPAQFFRAE